MKKKCEPEGRGAEEVITLAHIVPAVCGTEICSNISHTVNLVYPGTSTFHSSSAKEDLVVSLYSTSVPPGPVLGVPYYRSTDTVIR